MEQPRIDVGIAFLSGDLEGDVYMSQPDGCIVVGNGDDSFMVKLHSGSFDLLLYVDVMLSAAKSKLDLLKDQWSKVLEMKDVVRMDLWMH